MLHIISKNFFYSLLSILLTALIMIGSFVFYLLISLPNVGQLKDVHLQVPLKIYTSDNKLIAEFGEKKRSPVTLNQIPKLVVRAVLDTEDQRFYEHGGVDFIGLIRAAKNLMRTGKKSEGASTITMQVARNFFLSPEKTYSRKLKEMLLAFKIDHDFDKDTILELYLNKVYFGQRAYGVAAAAQVYYGKPLNELTLPEMAMLAGLPQAPSRDNPLTNPKAAIERRNHVLRRMLENNDISLNDYNIAIKTTLTAAYHGQSTQVYAPYIAEMVRSDVVARYGNDVYDQGLRVYTTIDSNMQNTANQKLLEGIVDYTKRHGYIQAEKNLGGITKEFPYDWQIKLHKVPVFNRLQPAAVIQNNGSTIDVLDVNGNRIAIKANLNLNSGDVIRILYTEKGWQIVPLPKVNGALVALDPKNGAIKALVGGLSYAQNNFNCVTQANRQPGSSLKPFIYSASLEKGYNLASIINDAPIVINDYSGVWRPQNFTRQFYGPTRLRVALVESRNLVSIRLLQGIGIPYAISYLERFGFKQQELPPSLSLALGTATVTPLELTAAYAVFANGGYRVIPYFVDRITNSNGQTILRVAPYTIQTQPIAPDAATSTAQAHVTKTQITPFAPQVISAQNAYLMNDVMHEIVQHLAGEFSLKLERQDLSGKTGTTQQQQDAWFAGFNSDLVTVVWFGYNIPQSLYEYGSQLSFPVWLNFMQTVLQGKPNTLIPQPPDIVTTRIDPTTGLLAYPEQKNSIFELFYKQNAPTKQANSAMENSNGVYFGNTPGASDNASSDLGNELF